MERRLREQLACPGHQRGCNFSVEVRLPACFVGECIEDTEGGRTKANSKPGYCGGLLLNQRKTTLKKACDFIFFSGLSFKTNKQCGRNHVVFPFVNSAGHSCLLPANAHENVTLAASRLGNRAQDLIPAES